MPDASLDKPPLPTRLADYRPPDFLIDEVALDFELGDTETLVKSHLQLRPNPEAATAAPPLPLDGDEFALVAISLDGDPLAPGDYALEADGTLVIANVPDAFALDTTTPNHPETNTQLSGLYGSGGNYCTQCEPEGFRRITWFLDRPDVMSRFTVTIRADKSRYPILLSNGNPSGSGDLADGRHFAKWVDPHPKPSYLFALVAGGLVAVSDTFTTRSGRNVPLTIWVRRGDEDKCGHAMASLKKSMRWDEETFGLEYDLDVFNIVAVSDFNMGAMENKGLNVFNTRYVLAKPDTATDTDYEAIEAVIAHEYFHNWTGNRVTCRDWFQLSLKEGLTVFRDQLFSADQGSAAVCRIGNVRTLRAIQFPEDAGRHAGDHGRGPLRSGIAAIRADGVAARPADPRPARQTADAGAAGDGSPRPEWRRNADPPRRRERRKIRHARPPLRARAAGVPLCRCRGAAGAVLAAQFLGAGEIAGRPARPAQISCDPRHRSGGALGCRSAGRDPRIARPHCGVSTSSRFSRTAGVPPACGRDGRGPYAAARSRSRRSDPPDLG